MGRPEQRPETARAGADRFGPGFHQPPGPGPGCLPGPGPVPDLRPLGTAGGAGGEDPPPRPGEPPPERPEPKYKNSQETAIYSKRRTLYALNWAKHDVIAQGEVVVCEGYTDVIGFFQAGVPRAVATCGTALAEEHFTLLRNFGRRIVLAYDADGAGQSATSRAYEWERKHEVDVVVADLPKGSDPGDLARSDPARAGPCRGRGPPIPAVPGGPHLERGRSDHGRGSGPGRRFGPDRGCRASGCPGARPVRHAAFGPLPARRAPPARTAGASACPPPGEARA